MSVKTSSNYTIHVVRSVDELALFSDGWRALYKELRCQNAFLSYSWCASWISSYGVSCNMYIVCIYRCDSLVLVAPLCFNKGKLNFLSKKIGFLSDPTLADYNGVLCQADDAEALCELFDFLSKAGFSILSMTRLRGFVGEMAGLECALTKNNPFYFKSKYCDNPCVKIEGDFVSYYSLRKKKLRQELRTTVSHLDRLGGWGYFVCDDQRHFNEAFDALVFFHLDRQQAKPGHSILSDKKNIDFLKKLNKNPHEFKLHMSVIRLADEIVSTVLCLVSGSTMYYWIPSFNPKIKSCSLGKLHIKCLLEEAYDMSYSFFDFMGGDEAYKYAWANDSYSLYNIRSFNSSLFLLSYKLFLAIRGRLKRYKRKSLAISRLFVFLSKLRN